MKWMVEWQALPRMLPLLSLNVQDVRVKLTLLPLSPSGTESKQCVHVCAEHLNASLSFKFDAVSQTLITRLAFFEQHELVNLT